MGAGFSTKLLSSKPNHTQTDLSGLSDWYTQGGQWCGACHDKRSSTYARNNHPDYACLDCHGDLSADYDFPHTGTVANLLTMEPDELCLQCHTAGTLP
jgi:hypothetical protein